MDSSDDIVLEKKVLDHGFVRLVDSMPGIHSSKTAFESAIVQMARVSYGNGTKSFREDMGLVRFLLENDHTSPFEGVVLKFHIKMPIFVARQWVRHRTASLNEYSARYSVINDEFYIPEVNRLNRQSKSNKQSSSNEIVKEPEYVQDIISSHSNKSYMLYKELMEKELSRELARSVIPVNVYTEMYWVMNLHNLFRFLRLRIHDHAQYEIRVFAQAICEILESIAPSVMDAWRSSQVSSVTLTGEEINLIKGHLSFEGGFSKPEGWSSRKFDALMQKINLLTNK